MSKPEDEGSSKKQEGDTEAEKNTDDDKLTLHDRIDSAVRHALINQSCVLVNSLTNMIKSVVDGSIAEEKAKGATYLPNNIFPPYRTIKTELTRSKQPIASIPIASASSAFILHC